MDLEKQGNHKFNFFKSNQRRQSLGFSNLKDANDYTTLLVVGLWILSGMFFRMDMRHQTVQETPKVQVVASVVTNPVSVQEKIKFISKIKSLKAVDTYKTNTPLLIKEINHSLEMVISSFANNEGVLEVQGYVLGSTQKIELAFEDDNISVRWLNVTKDEVQLFANAWKGDTETEVRTNPDNTTQTVLIANILKMNASPIAVAPTERIKSLEAQLEKLKEENIQLKKSNNELVVKQAIKDNPQLIGQEKQIQKFVDSFTKVSK